MSISLKPSQSWLSLPSLTKAAASVFSTINTPVSLGLRDKLIGGRFDEVVSASIDPKDYGCALSFARDYQAVSLLKKSAFLNTSFDRKEAAKLKFKAAEKQCEEANARIWRLSEGGDTHRAAVEDLGDLFGSLMKAQEIVHTILGSRPDISDFRFGPGTTSLVKGQITTPRKYSREIHVTPELYSYWRDVAGPVWCKTITDVHLVTGSTVSFVPKDAKTDRTIGIEPHLNIYAQLGVGAAMRKRFRPWIDLNVGQEKNRQLVKIAQRANLATIDFASASDTVSRAIVEFLVPPAWISVLDKVRSHRYLLDGDEFTFQKHSSMGNGYTFELESIIFYALARASCWGGNSFFRDVVSVYGDDVILPQCFAADFIRLSEYCGFTVNKDKSFLDGLFFESCGHDYFNGVNVRPYLWKENNPTLGFKVHNDLREMAYRLRLPTLENVAQDIRLSSPRDIRQCLIPSGYGHVGFVVAWDTAQPSVLKAKRGYDGFSTKALKFRSDKHDYSTDNRGLLAALDTSSMQSVAPVRKRGCYQVGRLETFGSWDGIGSDSH